MFFGLVIGGVAALLIFLGVCLFFEIAIKPHFLWWIFYGFGLFFFILGVVRGVNAADTVADAMHALLNLFLGIVEMG